MAISDVGFVDPFIIYRMCFCFSQRFATYFLEVLLRASRSTFSKSGCMHTQVLHMSFSSPCCVPRRNQRLLRLCSHSVEQGSVVRETKREDGLLMLLTTLAIMDASEKTSRTDQLINFLGQAGRQAGRHWGGVLLLLPWVGYLDYYKYRILYWRCCCLSN